MKSKELQEALGNCQHVYSDADKRTELSQIAAEEQFQANNLVTTKVAENGLSLHDNDPTYLNCSTRTLQNYDHEAKSLTLQTVDTFLCINDMTLEDLLAA